MNSVSCADLKRLIQLSTIRSAKENVPGEYDVEFYAQGVFLAMVVVKKTTKLTSLFWQVTYKPGEHIEFDGIQYNSQSSLCERARAHINNL